MPSDKPRAQKCPTCGRTEAQHTNPLAHKFREPYKPQKLPRARKEVKSETE